MTSLDFTVIVIPECNADLDTYRGVRDIGGILPPGGRRNSPRSGGEDYIFNGDKSFDYQWPWAAGIAIRYAYRKNYHHDVRGQ